MYCARSVSVCGQAEKEKQGRNDVSTRGQCLHSVHSVNCETENAYTPAFSAVQKLSSSPFVPSRNRSPSFLARDCVLGPSRCFVERSAVLFFVSTQLTGKRFSRIHCCIARHRISLCLSPRGPLRFGMRLAESESITRRTETLY